MESDSYDSALTETIVERHLSPYTAFVWYRPASKDTGGSSEAVVRRTGGRVDG